MGWGWYFDTLELSAGGESLVVHGRGGGLAMYDLAHQRFDYSQPWGSSSAAADADEGQRGA